MESVTMNVVAEELVSRRISGNTRSSNWRKQVSIEAEISHCDLLAKRRAACVQETK